MAPVFLSVLAELVPYPPQPVSPLFPPRALRALQLPPLRAVLLLPVGRAPRAARLGILHLVPTLQHRAVPLLTLGLTVLGIKYLLVTSVLLSLVSPNCSPCRSR